MMMITFTVPEENGKKVLTMDEYISREETIKRIKECYCTGCNSYNGVRCRACGTGDAIDVIEDAPVAYVAPAVRCKDCKHYDMGVCLKIYSDGNAHPEAWQSRKPEDFCSYGERKDDADG